MAQEDLVVVEDNIEYESSNNLYKTQNIYTDGEKIYYTLYNESINRYYFEAVGYNFEDEAERSMKGL